MPAALPLTDDERAFVCGPRSIYAASGATDHALSLVRALGCRVSDDGGSLLLVLQTEPARAVLDAISASRRIAAVYSDPRTNKTLQLKGNDAEVLDARPDASRLARLHVEHFLDVVVPLGYPEPIVRCLLGDPSAALSVVRFTPLARFEQTPGPAAGEKL